MNNINNVSHSTSAIASLSPTTVLDRIPSVPLPASSSPSSSSTIHENNSVVLQAPTTVKKIFENRVLRESILSYSAFPDLARFFAVNRSFLAEKKGAIQQIVKQQIKTKSHIDLFYLRGISYPFALKREITEFDFSQQLLNILPETLAKLTSCDLQFTNPHRSREGKDWCPFVGLFKATTEEVVAIANRCSNLRSLKLSATSDAPITVTFVKSYPALTSIDVSRSQITDDAAIAIAENCPNLTSINFRCCWNITVVGLMAILKKCTKLESADCSGAGLTTADETHVKENFPKLSIQFASATRQSDLHVIPAQ